MIEKEIFKMWAPLNTKWVDWIKPVAFTTIKDFHKNNQIVNFTIPNINYINKLQNNIAIILDCPYHYSIEESIALAKIGFRPIPIYNGVKPQFGVISLIDTNLEEALVWGALKLQEIKLSNDSPPVFLLDSNRTNRFKTTPSIFDNSWDLYDQDLPSADYFLKNNINKIIVKSNKLQNDLSKILFKFQEKGIVILFSKGYEKPKKIIIKKISKKK